MLDIAFLVDRFFSFSTWNVLVHGLLAFSVSDEIPTCDLIEDPFYLLINFSCCFQILCLWLLKFDMSCVSLIEFILEFVELLFLLMSLSKLGSLQSLFFHIFSLPLSFFSPSGVFMMHVLVQLMVSDRSLFTCFGLFSLCSLDSVIFIVLS